MSIEKNYINAFKGGVDQAFQQFDSRLRPYVDLVRQVGEFDSYDRIGLADDMREDNTRYGTNPMSEIQHDRRWIQTRNFENGKPIDRKDLEKVATDPTNAYTQAILASARRKFDDVVISTLTAPANMGKKIGDATATFVGTTSGKITVGALSNQSGRIVADTRYAVTAGNVEGIDIAKDYTGTTAANAGLTLAKLKAVKFTMLGTEAIDQDTTLNIFIGRRQLEDLLSIPEVINSDYAVRKALAEGKVTEYMGFRFIHTERLPLVEAGVRGCFCFLDKAVKMALSKDINADMWTLPDRKNIPYIYVSLGMGGTRMWGECLAQVRCVE